MSVNMGFYGFFSPGEKPLRGQVKLQRSTNRQPDQGLDTAIASVEPIQRVDKGIGFIGDICNRAALCRELGLPPTQPIEQMLQVAWQRWAAGMLQRLDGVFAMAVWDHSTLVLGTDASGLCKLYVHRNNHGQVAFATHLAALFRIPGVDRRLVRPSLHEYLRFLEVAGPSTVYAGVDTVEAGQLRLWSGKAESSVSAAPAAACATPHPLELADALDRLDGLLKTSIALRMEDSSRPGTFLSGGVDSSLICALAHRQRPDTVALTVGFEGARYDETPLAARIAAHLGMKHEVLRFGQRDYVAAFERLSETMDQPMADPAMPATLLAFEHCREHFDVVLDGTGADEAVGAMPPRHVRLAVEYGSLLSRPVRSALVRLMRGIPRVAGYTPILDFEHPADTMIRWKGFARTEIEALCGEAVSLDHTQFYRTFARFPRRAHYERYSALLDAMPSERLAQATLATGLLVRYPFFDRATNSYIRQLRTDFKYAPGQPKRILRELLARYVPRPLWDVPKHGFDFPLQQFLEADDFALVRRYLESGRWLDRGLLNADGVRRYARQFMAGDQRLRFRVWALVVLGAWLEKHDGLHRP